MKSQTKGDALFYLRRSNSRNELSLSAQLDWAIPEAQRLNVKFEATQADLSHMMCSGLSSFKSLRIDDGISGSEMDRPGFQALLKDVESNPKISHIITHRRDRFARPEDALRMATLERDIRVKGITFAFSNGIAGPADPSNPNLVDILTLVIEYYQNGDELRKIATRVLEAQRILADDGYSTGGDAPYGFVRVLVDSTGNEVEELKPGRRIRQIGCHVRWKAKDENKISIWVLILDLKLQGWGAKRIAKHLNDLGIPSPGAGRQRKDHGVLHRVTGKWGARTILELCRNCAIIGLKEYGRRSEGHQRRIAAEGSRGLTEKDRNMKNRPKLIHNDPALIVRKPSGSARYDESQWQDIQRQTDLRGKGQRGIPRASDPAKYPLSCRVVDLADGCGALMYGRVMGERRIYSCGRYMRTAGAECNNNLVDGEALLRLTVQTLKQLLVQQGCFDDLRSQLEKRARCESIPQSESAAEREIARLNQSVSQLREDREIIAARMARERNDERYEAIAREFDRLNGELRRAERSLAELQNCVPANCTASEQVEAALSLFSEIQRVCDDRSARAEIQSLLKQLDLWVGLDFAAAIKGKKREVRQLTGGVFVFGEENLPLPVYGRERVTPGKSASNNVVAIDLHSATTVGYYTDCKNPGLMETHDCCAKTPESCDPGSNDRHQEDVSSTKVNRGDRRCTFPTELAETSLLWRAIAQSVEFTADTFAHLAG